MLRGGSATVAVADFDRAVHFYTGTLGLTLLARFGDDWACIDAGNGLLIGMHPIGDGTGDRPTVSLCVTEPIESVVATLGDRGISIDGPIVELPMVKLAFFTDPDGNPICLTNMPPAPTAAFAQKADDGYRPFMDHLGLRMATVGATKASVELDLRDDLRGPEGRLQGGVTATLVDVAAASTVALSGSSRLVVTREMTVHYLTPGRVGPIRAVGELVRVGTAAATVDVKVYDTGLDGRLMAVALVSFAELTQDRSRDR